MGKLIDWVRRGFRKLREELKAARNLKGDGAKIGVDITPEGTTIRYLAPPEVEVIEITGAISGGVYPGKIWRRNGSTWVDTGATCEVIPL